MLLHKAGGTLVHTLNLYLFPIPGLKWTREFLEAGSRGSTWSGVCVQTSLHHLAQRPGLVLQVIQQCGWAFWFWRSYIEFGSKMAYLFFFCPTKKKKILESNFPCVKTAQTLHCHGSHDSFLITTFYFWDPKVLAVLRRIFTSWHFCLVLQEERYPGTQPGCSSVFLALNDVILRDCLATVGLIDEHLSPRSHTLPQTGQQIQLLSIVLAVPGRWKNTCSSLLLAVLFQGGEEGRDAAGINSFTSTVFCLCIMYLVLT